MLLAGAALAINVNITGDHTGTYSLDSMSVAADGTISLVVGSGGPLPPPGLTLGLNPSSLPAGTEGVAYSENVTMSASNGTAPYTFSCSTSGAGISASASNSVCSISGTPSTAGTYSVTFRVEDSAGGSKTQTSYFSVSAPGGCNEPAGIKTLTNGKSVRFVEIKAGATHYYKFTISPSMSGSWHGMLVSMGTNDWKTNQDMMFSLNCPYPTSRDYSVGSSVSIVGETINGSQKWASISKGSSNESVQISQGLQAGTYYVMVYNTASIDGVYELYYSAW